MTAINEEVILHFLNDDQEKLERLADYGLLYKNKSQISIDSRLQEFLEEYMEVDETVHILYIQENLDKIKELQSYFLKESNNRKKEEYLLKIKKHLRHITRSTLSNVKTLRTNTYDTYKLESNFEIKKEKLNNIRSQRDSLQGVLKAVNRILDNELFFRTAADDELLSVVHQLRVALNNSYHNLIEIQQQIIEYLNHIERRVQVVDKVLRLKSLRNKHHLKERTNFYDVITKFKGLPFKKSDTIRTRLPIHEMSENEKVHNLIFKVQKKLKDLKLLRQNVAGEIGDDALKNKESIENIINLFTLKNIFLGKQQDLFVFIMHHNFTEEVTKKERIRLYCRLASLYEKDFDFSHQTAFYEDMEYALVYPGNNNC
ncbi:MAG: hypothetical protein U9R32_07825 [Bacteroidota bacterium]|nr:hypothetical protein [Bacteroidota bacterium]